MSEARWSRSLNGFLALLLVMGLGVVSVSLSVKPAHAATNEIRGVNWADQRDNFVNGVLYPSGLSASDNYASATTVADRVVGQLFSLTGANTVRMPINEPTVADNWSAYTGAIDEALTKGNVILAYWAVSGGKPASLSAFYSMWDTVVNKYGNNPNAYFEVINEPYGYSATDLDNLYNNWLNRYPSVPRSRVILDGTGDATGVAAVGSDSRLDNTLLAVHDYSFFEGCSPSTSESYWENQFASEVGGYASRTVATEFGAPMSPGSKCGVSYGSLDYSSSSNDGTYFVAFLRGITNELRTLGMGSVYWPGLRDGDWYSLTTRSGSGASINLTLTNASGLARVQYGWGTGSGGGGTTTTTTGGGGGGGFPSGYGTLTIANDNLCLDGYGDSSNAGAIIDQYTCTGGANQNFQFVPTSGGYGELQVQNSGQDVTVANSSTAQGTPDIVQEPVNGNSASQWLPQMQSDGSYQFKNLNSGLCMDVYGNSSNTGQQLDQWPCKNTTGTNQDFRASATGPGTGGTTTTTGATTSTTRATTTTTQPTTTTSTSTTSTSTTSTSTTSTSTTSTTMPSTTTTTTAANGYPSGYHKLVIGNDSLCLDGYGNTSNAGAKIDQYTCNGQTNQQFQFVATSGGYGELQIENSGQDVTVANSSTAQGTPDIVQEPVNGNSASQWLPQKQSDGSYQFKNLNSGLCMDVYGNSSNTGQQLDQWPCKNTTGTNQDFTPQ